MRLAWVSTTPRPADSLDNLGTILAAQGDLDGAQTLCERALTIREARLGPDHPKIADSLDNLACLLRAQGDLGLGRLLLHRAISIREARLGLDHPSTVRR